MTLSSAKNNQNLAGRHHPSLNFADRLRKTQVRIDEKSGSALENETQMSEFSNFGMSIMNQTEGMTTLSTL